MKRIDICQYSPRLFDDVDIRPSLYRKIYDQLFNCDIEQIYMLCQKTEKDLLAIEGYDETIVDTIKNTLKEYGLSLGMTDEELAKYEDAEYDKRHTGDNESESHVVQPNSLVDCSKPFDVMAFRDIMANPLKMGFSIGNTPEQKEKKFVPLTDILRRKLLYKHERDVRDSFTAQLTERGLMRVCADDLEFMRIHIFRTFFADQPWYVRLFKNRKERMSLASHEADVMLNNYRKGLIEDMVKVSQQQFSKELDECWDKQWYIFLEMLEK